MKKKPVQCTRQGKSNNNIKSFLSNLKENDLHFEDNQITQCVFLGVLRLKPVPSVFTSNNVPSIVVENKSKRFRNNNSAKEVNKNISTKKDINKVISGKIRKKNPDTIKASVKKLTNKKPVIKIDLNMSKNKESSITVQDSLPQNKSTFNPVQNLFDKLKQQMDERYSHSATKESLFCSKVTVDNTKGSRKPKKNNPIYDRLVLPLLPSTSFIDNGYYSSASSAKTADEVIVINEENNTSDEETIAEDNDIILIDDIPTRSSPIRDLIVVDDNRSTRISPRLNIDQSAHNVIHLEDNNTQSHSEKPRKRRTLMPNIPLNFFNTSMLLRSELAQKKGGNAENRPSSRGSTSRMQRTDVRSPVKQKKDKPRNSSENLIYEVVKSSTDPSIVENSGSSENDVIVVDNSPPKVEPLIIKLKVPQNKNSAQESDKNKSQKTEVIKVTKNLFFPRLLRSDINQPKTTLVKKPLKIVPPFSTGKIIVKPDSFLKDSPRKDSSTDNVDVLHILTKEKSPELLGIHQKYNIPSEKIIIDHPDKIIEMQSKIIDVDKIPPKNVDKKAQEKLPAPKLKEKSDPSINSEVITVARFYSKDDSNNNHSKNEVTTIHDSFRTEIPQEKEDNFNRSIKIKNLEIDLVDYAELSVDTETPRRLRSEVKKKIDDTDDKNPDILCDYNQNQSQIIDLAEVSKIKTTVEEASRSTEVTYIKDPKKTENVTKLGAKLAEKFEVVTVKDPIIIENISKSSAGIAEVANVEEPKKAEVDTIEDAKTNENISNLRASKSAETSSEVIIVKETKQNRNILKSRPSKSAEKSPEVINVELKRNRSLSKSRALIPAEKSSEVINVDETKQKKSSYKPRASRSAEKSPKIVNVEESSLSKSPAILCIDKRASMSSEIINVKEIKPDKNISKFRASKSAEKSLKDVNVEGPKRNTSLSKSPTEKPSEIINTGNISKPIDASKLRASGSAEKTSEVSYVEQIKPNINILKPRSSKSAEKPSEIINMAEPKTNENISLLKSSNSEDKYPEFVNAKKTKRNRSTSNLRSSRSDIDGSKTIESISKLRASRSAEKSPQIKEPKGISNIKTSKLLEVKAKKDISSETKTANSSATVEVASRIEDSNADNSSPKKRGRKPKSAIEKTDKNKDSSLSEIIDLGESCRNISGQKTSDLEEVVNNKEYRTDTNIPKKRGPKPKAKTILKTFKLTKNASEALLLKQNGDILKPGASKSSHGKINKQDVQIGLSNIIRGRKSKVATISKKIKAFKRLSLPEETLETKSNEDLLKSKDSKPSEIIDVEETPNDISEKISLVFPEVVNIKELNSASKKRGRKPKTSTILKKTKTIENFSSSEEALNVKETTSNEDLESGASKSSEIIDLEEANEDILEEKASELPEVVNIEELKITLKKRGRKSKTATILNETSTEGALNVKETKLNQNLKSEASKSSEIIDLEKASKFISEQKAPELPGVVNIEKLSIASKKRGRKSKTTTILTETETIKHSPSSEGALNVKETTLNEQLNSGDSKSPEIINLEETNEDSLKQKALESPEVVNIEELGIVSKKRGRKPKTTTILTETQTIKHIPSSEGALNVKEITLNEQLNSGDSKSPEIINLEVTNEDSSKQIALESPKVVNIEELGIASKKRGRKPKPATVLKKTKIIDHNASSEEALNVEETSKLSEIIDVENTNGNIPKHKSSVEKTNMDKSVSTKRGRKSKIAENSEVLNTKETNLVTPRPEPTERRESITNRSISKTRFIKPTTPIREEIKTNKNSSISKAIKLEDDFAEDCVTSPTDKSSNIENIKESNSVSKKRGRTKMLTNLKKIRGKSLNLKESKTNQIILKSRASRSADNAKLRSYNPETSMEEIKTNKSSKSNIGKSVPKNRGRKTKLTTNLKEITTEKSLEAVNVKGKKTNQKFRASRSKDKAKTSIRASNEGNVSRSPKKFPGIKKVEENTVKSRASKSAEKIPVVATKRISKSVEKFPNVTIKIEDENKQTNKQKVITKKLKKISFKTKNSDAIPKKVGRKPKNFSKRLNKIQSILRLRDANKNKPTQENLDEITVVSEKRNKKRKKIPPRNLRSSDTPVAIKKEPPDQNHVVEIALIHSEPKSKIIQKETKNKPKILRSQSSNQIEAKKNISQKSKNITKNKKQKTKNVTKKQKTKIPNWKNHKIIERIIRELKNTIFNQKSAKSKSKRKLILAKKRLLQTKAALQRKLRSARQSECTETKPNTSSSSESKENSPPKNETPPPKQEDHPPNQEELPLTEKTTVHLVDSYLEEYEKPVTKNDSIILINNVIVQSSSGKNLKRKIEEPLEVNSSKKKHPDITIFDFDETEPEFTPLRHLRGKNTEEETDKKVSEASAQTDTEVIILGEDSTMIKTERQILLQLSAPQVDKPLVVEDIPSTSKRKPKSIATGFDKKRRPKKLWSVIKTPKQENYVNIFTTPLPEEITPTTSDEKKSPLKQATIIEMFSKAWMKKEKPPPGVLDMPPPPTKPIQLPAPSPRRDRVEDDDSDTESRLEWIPEEYAEYKFKYSANKMMQAKPVRKCKICQAWLPSYYKLLKHKKEHELQDRPYVCSQCGSEFKGVEDFSAHLRVHKGKHPYMCIKCDLGFWTKKAYEAHAPVHILKKVKQLPKKFRCDVCAKEFSKLCDIERHTRVHTGEKPCICNICNKRFQQAHNLSKHLLTHLHIKPYICEICNKQFGRNDVLRRHLLTHSIDKPVKCHVCSKGFIRDSQLAQHLRKKHPGQPNTEFYPEMSEDEEEDRKNEDEEEDRKNEDEEEDRKIGDSMDSQMSN